eukprot:351491-Chlamydomonas_euryale.AAC.6
MLCYLAHPPAAERQRAQVAGYQRNDLEVLAPASAPERRMQLLPAACRPWSCQSTAVLLGSRVLHSLRCLLDSHTSGADRPTKESPLPLPLNLNARQLCKLLAHGKSVKSRHMR